MPIPRGLEGAFVLESYDKRRGNQSESGHEAIEAQKRIVDLYEPWDAAEPGKGYAGKTVEYRAMLSRGDGSEVAELRTPSPWHNCVPVQFAERLGPFEHVG